MKIISGVAVETVPGTVGGKIAARFTDTTSRHQKETLCHDEQDLTAQAIAFASDSEDAETKRIQDIVNSPEGQAMRRELGLGWI